MASALREELQGVRVMELHARAAAEGVGEALLEDAMDSAEPRAALIELLVERQAGGAAQSSGAEQLGAEPDEAGGESDGAGTGAAARIIAGIRGDKAQREAAYVQLEALARGDSSGIGGAGSASANGGEREALVDVAAECVGPLIETVFTAEVPVVDAAEFRRAQLVLCELFTLDPLRLLAEYLRDSRIGLSWGTPGNAWAAVFDKEPSELSRDDALTVAVPFPTLNIQQARGESVRPALPRPPIVAIAKRFLFARDSKHHECNRQLRAHAVDGRVVD